VLIARESEVKLAFQHSHTSKAPTDSHSIYVHK
jgi:hypothetical protein